MTDPNKQVEELRSLLANLDLEGLCKIQSLIEEKSTDPVVFSYALAHISEIFPTGIKLHLKIPDNHPVFGIEVGSEWRNTDIRTEPRVRVEQIFWDEVDQKACVRYDYLEDASVPFLGSLYKKGTRDADSLSFFLKYFEPVEKND